MTRLAILGFWHVHAKDFIREARAEAGVNLLAGWDPDPAFGAEQAAGFGLPFEPDLAALLARDDLDGVVVTTETALHDTVIPAALRAGKHVVTEKVLSLTGDGARSLAAEAERAGRVLHVALNRLAFGSTAAILAEIAAGTVGTPTEARVRIAHDGAVATGEHPDGWLPARFYDRAATGGGALVDLGAHPLYLVRAILGMPVGVQALFGDVTGRGVDDHAAVLLRCPGDAIGIAETGFVSAGPFASIEVNGTTGNLHLGPVDGALWRRTARDSPWERVEPPPDGPTPFQRWLALLPGGVSDPENLAAAVDLSVVAEAAARSAAEGREIEVMQS
jgi:1,5-anhydro-D-fructose reductase (1,5-anhydro-D-mannitol-forming)